jgi:dehydrogenase/reductase SDR family member 1
MEMPSLKGKIAVVTGASRGIGKGIACELGRAGATVYVTGRTLEERSSAWPGSLKTTADDIAKFGGRAIPLPCDHRDDIGVTAAFERVLREQKRLDILVNSASAFGDTSDGYPLDEIPFWEMPVRLWDEMHMVGLRSHYVAAAIAAPSMIKQHSGLIVNVSSAGAANYVFNAAYGAAKAALDKLTADMARDLKGTGVTVVSVWPPFTRTEKYDAMKANMDLSRAKSPGYTGRTIVALAADPKLSGRTGQALRITELAAEYGVQAES